MNCVTVNASRKYDVTIGHGLLAQLGSIAADLKKPDKAVIISDSNVWPLHGAAADDSLRNAGFETLSFVFPAGEDSKTPQVYLEILNFLAQNHVTRSDMLIALGGGVVGDMAGFAAATYLRGITCIQVPTSLLAMVDSSVGGKTAIDLPAGKNLVGAFFQPSAVVCDLDTLSTLPEEIFIDGCAEVIKYAIAYDEVLFEHLALEGPAFSKDYVITRCVELKRDVVVEDEFDTGARQKLNLGHTIGHAIEALSNFSLSHGKAVAIGIAAIARAACKNGMCSQQTAMRIVTLLQRFGLPTQCSFSAAALYAAALSDKKRFGGTVNLIMPIQIGSCCIHPTPISSLQELIETGL